MLQRHIDIIESARFTGKLRKTKRVRLSRRFKQRIFFRDSGRCVYCDKPVAFKDVTMDHVMPLTKRGSNRSKGNIVTSCKACNKAKGPLELEVLGDLSPAVLDIKFVRMCEELKARRGHYKEWVSN